MTLSILTFNAALLDVRIFNHSVYCPVGAVHQRTPLIGRALSTLRPDIIFLQEIFHPELQTIICRQLGHEYPYATGRSRPVWQPRLGNELLTLSRFPATGIKMVRFTDAPLEEKIFTSKGFYHSTIELPGLGNIDCINFHTTAGGAHVHPEHDSMDSLRQKQINQILTYTENLERVILAGDLNAGPHTSTKNYQQVLQGGFIDTFSVVNADGYSWDPLNPLVANGKERHLPAQKIDHIFISESLSGLLRPVAAEIVLTGFKENPAELLSLSDHDKIRGSELILKNTGRYN